MEQDNLYPIDPSQPTSGTNNTAPEPQAPIEVTSSSQTLTSEHNHVETDEPPVTGQTLSHIPTLSREDNNEIGNPPVLPQPSVEDDAQIPHSQEDHTHPHESTSPVQSEVEDEWARNNYGHNTVTHGGIQDIESTISRLNLAATIPAETTTPAGSPTPQHPGGLGLADPDPYAQAPSLNPNARPFVPGAGIGARYTLHFAGVDASAFGVRVPQSPQMVPVSVRSERPSAAVRMRTEAPKNEGLSNKREVKARKEREAKKKEREAKEKKRAASARKAEDEEGWTTIPVRASRRR